LTIINDTTLSNNSAFEGGGIYGGAGTVQLSNITLSGNSANYGAAIFNSNSVLSLNASTVSGNSATEQGGGIWIVAGYSGTVTITGCTFTANRPDNIFGPWIDGGGNSFLP